MRAILTRFIRSDHAIPLISFSIYVGSLLIPGMYSHGYNGNRPIYGYDILVSGAAGIINGNFAWFANIIYFGALLLLVEKRGKYISQILLVAAIFFGLTSFSIVGVSTFNEGGSSRVYILGPGFLVWLFSFVILLAYLVIKVIWTQE